MGTASVFYESANEFATLQNTFAVDGTNTDPTDVTLTVTSPSGTETTYTYSLGEITQDSTGVYSKSVSCNEAGDWAYVWTGTVVAADVVSGTWTVFPLTLGKLYATVDALKSRLGVAAGTDTLDDYEIHMACFTASRSIEDFCGRVFYRSAPNTVRTFRPKNYYCVELPPFSDIVSVSSLKTDSAGDGTFETTWSSSDYQLLWGDDPNATAYPEPRPYDVIKAVGSRQFPVWDTSAILSRADRVQVTGTFGWPSVPFGIRQATLILADDIFNLKDSAFKSGGWSEFGRIRARQNPHVVTMCHSYRRAFTAFPVRPN